MSKVDLHAKVPPEYNRHTFADLMRDIEVQINGLSESRIVAQYNARPTIPTTGQVKRGDFIPNSEPSELGGAGSRYVILGWICTASGEPGTLLQCRVLTGN